MDQYPVLPQSVWSGDCVGQKECTLEMGHVGGSDYVCSDVSGVENAYYNAVNGVEMEQVDGADLDGYKEECQMIAMKVQALCKREASE